MELKKLDSFIWMFSLSSEAVHRLYGFAIINIINTHIHKQSICGIQYRSIWIAIRNVSSLYVTSFKVEVNQHIINTQLEGWLQFWLNELKWIELRHLLTTQHSKGFPHTPPIKVTNSSVYIPIHVFFLLLQLSPFSVDSTITEFRKRHKQ